jgi:hypothetical protein
MEKSRTDGVHRIRKKYRNMKIPGEKWLQREQKQLVHFPDCI